MNKNQRISSVTEEQITFLHYMLERYDLDIIESLCVIRNNSEGILTIFDKQQSIKDWDYSISRIKIHYPKAFEHKALELPRLEYLERDFVKPIIK